MRARALVVYSMLMMMFVHRTIRKRKKSKQREREREERPNEFIFPTDLITMIITKTFSVLFLSFSSVTLMIFEVFLG